MTRFTKLLRVLLIVFLLLLLLVTYGLVKLQEIKHNLGITVDWQNLQIGFNGITFEKLTIDQQSSDGKFIIANSQNIIFSFSTLTIKQLDVKIQGSDYITKENDKASQIDLAGILNTLSWAPHRIQVEQFNLSMPCGFSDCNLSGNLQLLQKPKTETPVTIFTTLIENDQKLEATIKVHQKNQRLGLLITANFNQEPLLTLNTEVDSDKLAHWQGTFDLYKIKNINQFFSFVQQILPNQQVLTEIPDAAEVNARWQLYFPQGLTSLKPEQGTIDIKASLPNPWPIIHVGYLQGILDTQLTVEAFQLKLKRLNTDLIFTNLSPSLFKWIPNDLQINTIHLKLLPLETDNESINAIELSLITEGTLKTLFHSNVLINRSKLEIILNNSNLQASTSKLSVSDYTLQDAKILLPFNATITREKASLEFLSTGYLKAQQLMINRVISFKNLQLTTDALKLNADYQDKNNLQWSIETPITLTTTALTHSVLKTLSWKLTGQVNADSKKTVMTAKISNGADLSASSTLTTDYQKQLSITGKTPDLFFRNTNMFAKTFKDWPTLLDINTGKVTINNITLTIPFGSKPLIIAAKANLVGLSGIYDRSEFRDLTGQVLVNLNNNQLKVKLPDLTLTEANPGFDMGPLQFIGEYKASITGLLTGVLTWSKAELTLFAGEVWLKPGELNLAKLPQEIDVQIKNLQLNKILTAYPTEGLNGEGDIYGHLPIVITNIGIDIKEGELAARQPGYIKFDSPAIQAIGENNPNMKLVTQALENFQYSVLSSKISYNQGDAILGLQIKGRNPDIEGGLPINLNVNLQENIPALMTTLQLSDRVSDIIQKRVQKRLQQEASKK